MTDLKLRVLSHFLAIGSMAFLLGAAPDLTAPRPKQSVGYAMLLCGQKPPLPDWLALQQAKRQAFAGDREALYGLLHHYMSEGNQRQAYTWVKFAASRHEWSLAVPYWKRLRVMGDVAFCRRADQLAQSMLRQMPDKQPIDRFYRSNVESWLAAGKDCSPDIASFNTIEMHNVVSCKAS